MAETQDKWRDVISKMEGLGLKLKLHLEQEKDSTDESSKPGDTKAALDELGAKLQDAFNSMGSAAKDPAVKTDVKDIGTSLKDAMMQTFSAVGAHVDDVVKKTSSTDSSEDSDESEASTPQDSVADEEE